MRIKKLLVCLAVILAMSLSLGACGKSSDGGDADEGSVTKTQESANDPALEKALDEMQSTLDSLKKQYEDTFKMDTYVKGNAMVYSYTYVQEMDAEATAEVLEAEKDSLEKAALSDIEILKSSGARDPSVIYEYFNSDGTLIWASEFK